LAQALDERLGEAIERLDADALARAAELDERRDRELEAVREALRGELERGEAEIARLRSEGEAATEEHLRHASASRFEEIEARTAAARAQIDEYADRALSRKARRQELKLARQERERRIRAAERRVEARGDAVVTRARAELGAIMVEARAELVALRDELDRTGDDLRALAAQAEERVSQTGRIAESMLLARAQAASAEAAGELRATAAEISRLMAQEASVADAHERLEGVLARLRLTDQRLRASDERTRRALGHLEAVPDAGAPEAADGGE
jgi:hypothetical protein